MASIYIHIPFCHSKCYYCGFHSVASLKSKDEMITAICRELDLRKDYLNNEQVETIYFGGGTPSLLSAEEVGRIITVVHKYYKVSDDAEISFEGNPEDIIAGYPGQLAELGINRMSIGLQSLDDDILKYLNRRHTAAEAVNAVENIYKAGITNISIDFIYGIPGLTDKMWADTLKRAGDLPVKHLSAYCLSIDPNTVFDYRMKQGKMVQVSDEASLGQYKMLVEWAKERGFVHYEISNFCKPDYHSRHNSSYWLQKKYLGIGPSAHSYNGISRQWNTSNNPKYIRGVSEGNVDYEIEYLSDDDRFNEYVMTSLRTMWGMDKNYVRRVLGERYYLHLNESMQRYRESNYIINEKDKIYLTEKGMFVSNEIISDLFI